ncbi:hypothetical protein J6590_005602 [Homalodisca vitripennis]|nr:hypothetical protein J6590_005602 [Homalodisca vitripennis]
MFGSVILFCVFLILIYLWKYKKPENFPPGPTPRPVIGNVMDLPKGHLYLKVEEWSKIYGQIIGLRIFNDLAVFVTGVDNILLALRKEEFQSRPDIFSVKTRNYGKSLGLFFGTGDQWNSTRKFTVKQMRAFGKFEKVNLIVEEIDQLMETIKDGTMQGNGLFGLAAVNVIWMIIANKRIDINDTRSRRFLKNLNKVFRLGSPSGRDIVDVFPILRFVNSRFKFTLQVFKETHDFIRETIQEHRESLDPNNPRDLIDSYLIEMDCNKGNPDSRFTEEDLIVLGTDLFSAGAESTSNSIEFVLLYMILYPEVQEKMQEEIDRVLGRGRKPVLDDKANLHYTMAVLNEVERINSVVPTNVPHYCVKDTTFGGYFIPKGTLISMNLRSLGYDPKYWKNPEEFHPERFLDSEGKYVKPSNMPSFGIGQRTCVGEMMARTSIFLFTTTFFEKFSISLPAGEPKPSTVALPGFTTAPQPF